jgi:outer membrane protein assembly factor BamB
MKRETVAASVADNNRREWCMNDSRSPVPAKSLPVRAVSAEQAALSSVSPCPKTHLRLWPGVIIIALLWLLPAAAAWFVSETMIHMLTVVLTPTVMTVALLAWWLFFSRLRWADRLLGLLALAAAGGVTYPFWHHSLTDDDSKGVLALMVYVLPAVTTAWVAWLLVTPFLRWPVRRVGLLAVFVMAWGSFTLVRFEGNEGDFSGVFRYRGTLTAEEKYLAEREAGKLKTAPAADSSAAPLALQAGDWPGFRGPKRDGRLTGVRIATNWQQHPPREIWRRRIGPGWSSFAVVGDRLYTQEQRGKDEAVLCCDTGTGVELWAHEDKTRFGEARSGAGPRATPTFHDGKIYALGATGRLNCLDAATGNALWSQDIIADSGAKVPECGFTSSPLVADGIVMVFAGGPDDRSVLGYEASLGKLVWTAGYGQFSYSSPHLARLDGSDQVLIATDTGLTSLLPANGHVLWRYDWPLPSTMARIVQPVIIDDFDVLLGTGYGFGTRRLRVAWAGDGWGTTEVWSTGAIKPYYNDLVVHLGYLYGFDGSFFTCVSLDDGRGKWRARGYGNGQVLLLADQDLLLVLSEKGEVALLKANPDSHQVLGRFQALDEKTWNHPVVAHGKLFVRNGAEAACYKLAGDD